MYVYVYTQYYTKLPSNITYCRCFYIRRLPIADCRFPNARVYFFFLLLFGTFFLFIISFWISELKWATRAQCFKATRSVCQKCSREMGDGVFDSRHTEKKKEEGKKTTSGQSQKWFVLNWIITIVRKWENHTAYFIYILCVKWQCVQSKKSNEMRREKTDKREFSSLVWQSCINAFLSMIYWLIVADYEPEHWKRFVFAFLLTFNILKHTNTRSHTFVYISRKKVNFYTLQSHCIIINSASIKTNLLYQVSASRLSYLKNAFVKYRTSTQRPIEHFWRKITF